MGEQESVESGSNKKKNQILSADPFLVVSRSYFDNSTVNGRREAQLQLLKLEEYK